MALIVIPSNKTWAVLLTSLSGSHTVCCWSYSFLWASPLSLAHRALDSDWGALSLCSLNSLEDLLSACTEVWFCFFSIPVVSHFPVHPVVQLSSRLNLSAQDSSQPLWGTHLVQLPFYSSSFPTEFWLLIRLSASLAPLFYRSSLSPSFDFWCWATCQNILSISSWYHRLHTRFFSGFDKLKRFFGPFSWRSSYNFSYPFSFAIATLSLAVLFFSL